jgi:exportin-2 (importin alpha re-exporter)
MQENFSLYLLRLLEDTAQSQPVKLAAAIYFKNHVRRAWPSEAPLRAEERATIKGALAGMMLRHSPSVARQLGEALAIVAAHDFPGQWPELIPELLQRLADASHAADWPAVLGVLKTCSRVFKRYRSAFKCDEVLLELRYILGLVQAPLLDIFKALCGIASTAPVFRCLKVVAKLFYALNYVDLPEYFEDHMAEWMEGFRRFLQISPAKAKELHLPREIIEAESAEKPGLVFQLQAAICTNVNLYAEKYEEEFQPYLELFLADIWALLLGVGQAERFDQVWFFQTLSHRHSKELLVLKLFSNTRRFHCCLTKHPPSTTLSLSFLTRFSPSLLSWQSLEFIS